MTENKSKGFNLKEIIFIIIITAIITSMTTGIILYNQNKLTKNITYQDLNNDEALKEFLQVYASLLDEYYEDVDKTAMLESAINGMLNYLGEDYSTYMNKEETDALAKKLVGEYKGIGITINQNNEIIDLIEGGSAKEAGLLIGDKIIAINGNVVDETKNNEENFISSYLKQGNEGDKYTLSIIRDNVTYNFETEIRTLYIPALQYKMLDHSIGYIYISSFSGTLKNQMIDALNYLENEGMESLIIDIRNNTGGYLFAAQEVASLFLEKGKTIYSLEEKDGIKEYKDETDEKRDYKIVLLQNEGSASASEILIAALKESYGATVVGTTSYGKGKVQQTYSLDDGSMVKYTSAKWLTPTGNCIDEIGISPDIYVEELSEEEDVQLEKAIEVSID